jgi:ATP-binding cassette, subfamily C (CFTR/MRP), member 1
MVVIRWEFGPIPSNFIGSLPLRQIVDMTLGESEKPSTLFIILSDGEVQAPVILRREESNEALQSHLNDVFPGSFVMSVFLEGASVPLDVDVLFEKAEEGREYMVLTVPNPAYKRSIAPQAAGDQAKEGDAETLLKKGLISSIEHPWPEENATILSKITFKWMTKLIQLGYERPLQNDDLYICSSTDDSLVLLEQFDRIWQRDIQKGKANPNVLSVTLRVLWKPLVFGGILGLAYVALTLALPILLWLAIGYLENEEGSLTFGIVLAVAFWVVIFAASICFEHKVIADSLCGYRARSIYASALYRKALNLSNDALAGISDGEMVSRLGVDCERVFTFFANINNMWTLPLQLLGIFALLFAIFFIASIGCLISLAILIVVNILLTGMIGKVKSNFMQISDRRVEVTTECINAMKVIKLFGWEEVFQSRISRERRQEIKQLFITAVLQSFWIALNISFPLITAIITYNIYVWTGELFKHFGIVVSFLIETPSLHIPMIGTIPSFSHVYHEKFTLTLQEAFVTLNLFTRLQSPLMEFILALLKLVEGMISLGRISKFLQLEEKVQSNKIVRSKFFLPGISIESGHYSWGTKGGFEISNVNMEVKPGEIHAVVGSTGSGKTSLTLAILDQMDKISGQATVRGKVAYVPQSAWIFSASVRENILFGRPFEAKRYAAVLRASCMEKDLESFSEGDLTILSEGGSNLSGGQKQRISIARGAYADADVYVFDDPLSALDAQVSNELFRKMMLEYLNRKAVVLVINQLQFLKQCSVVSVLEGGRIVESGVYDDLIQNPSSKISTMVESYSHNNEEVESVNERRKSVAVVASSTVPVLSPLQHLEGAGAETVEEEVGDTPQKQLAKPVSFSTYWAYVRASGTPVFPIVIFLCLFLYGLTEVCRMWWMEVWGTNALDASGPFYVTIFSVFSLLLVLMLFVRTIATQTASTFSSKNLHSNLIRKMLRLPIGFYDETQSGMIMDRFSQDVNFVDTKLNLTLDSTVMFLMFFFVFSFIVCAVAPLFIIPFVALLCVYSVVQGYFSKAFRRTTAMDMTALSKVLTFFSESAAGSASIRTYSKLNDFYGAFNGLLMQSMRPKYLSLYVKRWTFLRVGLIGATVVGAAMVVISVQRALGFMSSGAAALALAATLALTEILRVIMLVQTEMEPQITSVERLLEYTRHLSEAPLEIPENDPESSWPQKGSIEFKNFTMSYRPDLDPVVRDLTFSVAAGEKIGVVGRTGAGKSSLIMCLFRLVEASGGSVLIDDVDISKLGLHRLRRSVSIIPQDPVMFKGTLRFNLDPEGKYDDDAIWGAVERAHLKKLVEKSGEGLEMWIDANGGNLSLGQQQLVCLGRALLEPTKILVMDEASAAVDADTDALIQYTVRTEFADRTILSIAHRLDTIIDFDRILVLELGTISEFASPKELLANSKSLFYSLCHEAEKDTTTYLNNVACGMVNHLDYLRESISHTTEPDNVQLFVADDTGMNA